jgi:uncharacterized iron-regulated membrane protein
MGASFGLRQRLWRWHFFAGLMVCPFAILLSITGSIYLFKPQIDSYVEETINANAPVLRVAKEPISPDQLVNDLLAKYPSAKLKAFTLAKDNDRSVEIELRHINGQVEIFWLDHLTGKTLDSAISDKRFLAVVKDLHGELLLGNRGSYVVELMASWMIVLIITGLYLWLTSSDLTANAQSKWRRWFVPQFHVKRARSGYKSLHGVIGIWFTLPILVLLLSGLPWTQLWGSGFKQFQAYMGWQDQPQFNIASVPVEQNGAFANKSSLWEISSDPHKHHNHSADKTDTKQINLSPLAIIVESLKQEDLAPPVLISPPSGNSQIWSARSMSQQRSERVTINFHPITADELSRIEFADRHPVRRAVSHGISLHEGVLFGWFNQLLGLLTAVAIIVLSTFGLLIWWLRRPKGQVSAPPKVTGTVPLPLILLILVMGLLLPAAGISFIVVAVLDKCYLLLNKGQKKAV